MNKVIECIGYFVLGTCQFIRDAFMPTIIVAGVGLLVVKVVEVLVGW
jgi:hypothetical protein